MAHQTSTYNFHLHKHFLGGIGILILMAALPMAMLVVQKSQDIRQKAAGFTPLTPDCNPVNNIIYVYPTGTDGGCQNIQAAIDKVPDHSDQHYQIKIYPGIYTLTSDQNYALKIQNKSRLEIGGRAEVGDDVSSVQLQFPDQRGGIYINSPNVNLSWLTISGHTTNGLVKIEGTTNTQLAYLNLADTGANTVQIFSTQGIAITTSTVSGSGIGIYAQDTGGLSVTNSILGNSPIALQLANVSADIKWNLITNTQDKAIGFYNPGTVNLEGNTIADSHPQGNSGYGLFIGSPGSGAVISLKNNLIAQNNSGITVEDNQNATFTFDHNDIWNGTDHTNNFSGISNPTGHNGNISADPLFGPHYCINPGSPAMYGDAAQHQYMGVYGTCYHESSPSPSPALDDLWIDSSHTRVDFFTPSGEPIPQLGPNLPVKARVQYAIQNTLKSDAINLNPVRTIARVNGTEVGSNDLSYSLITQHLGGASGIIEFNLTTPPTTFVLDILTNATRSINESDYGNNLYGLNLTYLYSTPSPAPSPVTNPADANGDGLVNLIDYDVFLGRFIASLQNNGAMTLADYDIFLTNFIKALNN